MRLHFQEYGSGPPLVILHGLFGSADNWHSVSQRLGEEFRVFALDLRNHGRSPHSAEMNFQAMAGDVAEFIKSHLTGSGSSAGASVPGTRTLSSKSTRIGVHLLGHSLGGKVAMELALGESATIDSLIVADMAPRSYSPRHREILDALRALDLAAFEDRRQIEAALAGPIPPLAVRRFLLKAIQRDASGVFHWRLNLDAIDRNYSRLSEAVSGGRTFAGPTLFIRGANSRYVREEDTDLIRRLFPKAEIHTLAAAGHWLHADAPELFVRTVREFLRRVTNSA